MKVCLDPKYVDEDCFDTVWITLDATQASTLQWDTQFELAKKSVKKGKKLVFYLDFGLQDPSVLSSETFLYSLMLTIDHFNQRYPEFKEHIAAICLLKTDLEFYRLIDWDFELLNELKKTLKVKCETIHEFLENKDLKFKLNLFSSQLIANLLNLLLSQLPEELEALILIDSKWKEVTYCYQILTQNVFSNFSFAVKDLPIGKYQWTKTAFYKGYFLENPAHLVPLSTHNTIGFLVSNKETFLEKEPQIFQLTSKLQKLGIALTVIEEEQLSEHWRTLDAVIGFKSLFSENALRQLQGFLATDGLFYDLDQEQHVDRFLSLASKELSLKVTKLKDLSKQVMSKYLPPSAQ
ncbi:MAG: hypothetical protein K940chlam8_00464 [Chlamydiae bacterium]|nr:hypothetical protein [Chlamydiota bacterium]